MLRDFYVSLPTPSVIKSFYVKGYTEALAYFSGVKVVPHSSYIESSDAIQFQKHFLLMESLPCYFIPIFYDRNCYGFVLKGGVKATAKYTTSFLVPGCERIQSGQTVFMVEGLKDCGPLLSLGLTTIPMLTSAPTKLLLEWLRIKKQCRVVIIPDYDPYLKTHLESLANLFKSAGYSGFKKDYYISLLDPPPNGADKCDLGDYYDLGSSHDHAVHNLRKIVTDLRGLGWV